MTMVANISDSLKRAAKSALRQVIGPAIGSCVVAYFVYYAVQGDRGLIALKHLQGEIAQAQSVLEQVRGERERMERRAQLLHTDRLDRDMLDERARTMLSLTHQNDVILTLPPVYDGDDTPATTAR
ncbi:MAG TPA: septum formation initiator family protein [Azospirillum sp.]|nr:septum formation initiator family protein [Azospirillum sp.]